MLWHISVIYVFSLLVAIYAPTSNIRQSYVLSIFAILGIVSLFNFSHSCGYIVSRIYLGYIVSRRYIYPRYIDIYVTYHILYMVSNINV